MYETNFALLIFVCIDLMLFYVELIMAYIMITTMLNFAYVDSSFVRFWFTVALLLLIDQNIILWSAGLI